MNPSHAAASASGANSGPSNTTSTTRSTSNTNPTLTPASGGGSTNAAATSRPNEWSKSGPSAAARLAQIQQQQQHQQHPPPHPPPIQNSSTPAMGVEGVSPPSSTEDAVVSSSEHETVPPMPHPGAGANTPPTTATSGTTHPPPVATGSSGSQSSSAVGNASGAPNGGAGTFRFTPAVTSKMFAMSYRNLPHALDCEKAKPYLPPNPYRTMPFYPQQPHPILSTPELFRRLDADTLFFIFYYQQATYQQYLAAAELKRQSWRYHKKYLTWFQRQEKPRQVTEDFEEGNYIYFDYESGWSARSKQEFTFKYSYLEDELV